MKFIFLLMLSLSAQAALKTENGMILPYKVTDYPMKSLVKDYAELMDITISFPKSLIREQDKVSLEINSKMNKEEFQQIVFNLLYNRGFTPIDQSSITWIYNARDIRYLSVPLSHDLNFPNDARFRSLVYRLKYPISEMVAWNLRPYMSRYGRVIDFADARTLIINDSSDNLKRLAKTIEYMDTEATFKNFVNDKPKKRDDDFDPTDVRVVELEAEKKIMEKKYLELKEKEEMFNYMNQNGGKK